jgi:hypothetical protein
MRLQVVAALGGGRKQSRCAVEKINFPPDLVGVV